MALTKPSSTQTTFSLFNDLLPELRLKVYKIALATPKALSYPDENCIDGYGGRMELFQGVALLRSSQKIYNEALPIFYAVNLFHFDLGDLDCWSRSPDLSNNIAMIRHIDVAAFFCEIWLDDLCASLLNELLHRFPQLHSFAFSFSRTYPKRSPLPPLNEMAEIFVDLRQRVKSMEISFDFHDEENLQRLRDMIAPRDEWRYQKDSYWHIYSIGPWQQTGTLKTNRQGCTVEKL